MKAVNTTLNVVLLVAVGYLFFHEFGGDKATKSEVSSDSFSPAKIAFFNIDSLAKQYEYYQEKLAVLEKKGISIQDEIAVQSNGLRESYEDYQKNEAKYSDAKKLQLQQELQQIEGRILAYKQQRENELLAENQELTNEVADEIQEVMDQIKDELGVDYVLNKDRSGIVMSVNNAFDITEMAAKRLNEKHAKDQNEEEKTE